MKGIWTLEELEIIYNSSSLDDAVKEIERISPGKHRIASISSMRSHRAESKARIARLKDKIKSDISAKKILWPNWSEDDDKFLINEYKKVRMGHPKQSLPYITKIIANEWKKDPNKVKRTQAAIYCRVLGLIKNVKPKLANTTIQTTNLKSWPDLETLVWQVNQSIQFQTDVLKDILATERLVLTLFEEARRKDEERKNRPVPTVTQSPPNGNEGTGGVTS